MNLPQAYLNRMQGQLGADFDAYLAAMEAPERRAARTNGLKLTAAELAGLRLGGTDAGIPRFSPSHFRKEALP